jgi:hypothetical protein
VQNRMVLLLRSASPVILIFGLVACGGSQSLTPPTVATPTLPTASDASTDSGFACKAGVIEQSFEHGFMFWVGQTTQEKCRDQHAFTPGSGEIWVAILDNAGTSGRWLIFVDDWQAGIDPENDPSLTPPPNTSQPMRGFGKVWRLRLGDAQRATLGWATGDELPFTSNYRYEGRSFTNSSGEVIPRPGEHFLNGLAGDHFVFDEISQTVTYAPH